MEYILYVIQNVFHLDKPSYMEQIKLWDFICSIWTIIYGGLY